MDIPYVKAGSTPCKHTSLSKTSTTAKHKLLKFTVEWQSQSPEMTNQQLEDLWQLGLYKTHPSLSAYEHSELATDLLDRTCQIVYAQRVSTPKSSGQAKPVPLPIKQETWQDKLMSRDMELMFLSMLNAYIEEPSEETQKNILSWIQESKHWYPPSLCCWLLSHAIQPKQHSQPLKWLPLTGLPEGMADWIQEFIPKKQNKHV
jgi:hypothetical protein